MSLLRSLFYLLDFIYEYTVAFLIFYLLDFIYEYTVAFLIFYLLDFIYEYTVAFLIFYLLDFIYEHTVAFLIFYTLVHMLRALHPQSGVPIGHVLRKLQSSLDFKRIGAPILFMKW
jgi:hypothetical protein